MFHHNILPFILIITHLVSSQSSPLAPALYVFGDSILDNGNNNMLPTLVKANYHPYSIKFPAHVPLGRFMDGRTIADFIAEFLELPYPPPYVRLFGPNWISQSDIALSSNLFRESLITGYNYASAACGILPETGSLYGKCISMDEQIEMFEGTIKSQLAPIFNDDGQLSQYLSKSIFLIITGNNDYIQNYLNPLILSSKQYDPDQFAQLLVDTFSLQIKRLYELGARKIILSDIGPLGCTPFFTRSLRRTFNNSEICGCDENVNLIVSKFNDCLDTMFQNLTASLIDSHFILQRSYHRNYDLIMHPANYGFSDNKNPCCTSWMNGKLLCVPNVAPCGDSDKHIFWDGFHPTEAATRDYITQCIFGSSICVPFNIKQLVQA
ncbi:unnamed protein product [Amaranthus hypochondriacus]